MEACAHYEHKDLSASVALYTLQLQDCSILCSRKNEFAVQTSIPCFSEQPAYNSKGPRISVGMTHGLLAVTEITETGHKKWYGSSKAENWQAK